MPDGSSISIKVAQYFVNKKIQEINSKDPNINEHQDKFLQALPRFDKRVPEQVHGADEPPHGGDEPPSQPPPFFPAPTGEPISWKSLLEYNRSDRWRGQPPPEELIFPPWYYVAIIGAGVAGLRTAMLLQDMGIPYKIFEASDRPGGRIFTYEFASKPPNNPKGKHDYYDVGAMRFPDNDANKKAIELFQELDLSSKMIKFVFSNNENIRYYNGIKATVADISTPGDHFNDEIVPKEYFYKEHIDLRGNKVIGLNACVGAAYDPFRKILLEDFDKGWEELMKYDSYSTRSYLMQKYPFSVVHWMENRTGGTGSFDQAFPETILISLIFDDPRKDVEWWAFEGGSKVLIDAMVNKLNVKPSYDHRVTSIEPVYQLPEVSFPNLPPWPNWPPSLRFPFMKVSVSGKLEEEFFSHVVSTVSFANLGTIDTDKVFMTYMQRQAIRTLNYRLAVKVGIKFKKRWWEQDGMKQRGGSSSTDRQSRTVVYPSYGLDEKEDPGVLIVTYNLNQDGARYGALIQNPEWSQLDPDRKRPQSEQILLEQIYGDLAVLHGVTVDWLRKETLDYHAFNWYHSPYTMGAFAHFTPGQFSNFFFLRSWSPPVLAVFTLLVRSSVPSMRGSSGRWIRRCG